MTEPGVAPAAASEPTSSRLDDYVDVYLSPTEVFDRRRDGRWGQALLVLALVSAALYYGFLPAAEIVGRAEMARVIAETPQAAEGVAAMEAAGRSMRWIGGILVPIATAAAVFLLGVVLRGAAALFGIGVSFPQALVVATFAHFITLPRALAHSVSVILANRDGQVSLPADGSFGPLRFLEAGDAIQPLLSRLEVFTLWEAALWGVGLYVIGRSGRGAAMGAAVAVLAATAVPGLVVALVR